MQRRITPDIPKLGNIWYLLIVDQPCKPNQDAICGIVSYNLLWFDYRHSESTNIYSSKFKALEPSPYRAKWQLG